MKRQALEFSKGDVKDEEHRKDLLSFAKTDGIEVYASVSKFVMVGDRGAMCKMVNELVALKVPFERLFLYGGE
jgi:hypothetical protein